MTFPFPSPLDKSHPSVSQHHSLLPYTHMPSSQVFRINLAHLLCTQLHPLFRWCTFYHQLRRALRNSFLHLFRPHRHIHVIPPTTIIPTLIPGLFPPAYRTPGATLLSPMGKCRTGTLRWLRLLRQPLSCLFLSSIHPNPIIKILPSFIVIFNHPAQSPNIAHCSPAYCPHSPTSHCTAKLPNLGFIGRVATRSPTRILSPSICRRLPPATLHPFSASGTRHQRRKVQRQSTHHGLLLLLTQALAILRHSRICSCILFVQFCRVCT